MTNGRAHIMLQPTAEELLWALTCVLAENTALRIECGRPLADIGVKRFDRRELAGGKHMRPSAQLDSGDKTLIVCWVDDPQECGS